MGLDSLPPLRTSSMVSKTIYSYSSSALESAHIYLWFWCAMDNVGNIHFEDRHNNLFICLFFGEGYYIMYICPAHVFGFSFKLINGIVRKSVHNLSSIRF